MDIKQIRTDYENGTVIGRATWAELLAHVEQADSVLNGRQQKIGEQAMAIATLECRIGTLEQDCRDWEKAHKDAVSLPRKASNPAAHDWAAPSATIDSDKEFMRLLRQYREEDSGSHAFVIRENIITYIDARIAAAEHKAWCAEVNEDGAREHLAEVLAAGMVDKPQWISVDERLPKCNKKPNSFGAQVLIWPHSKSDMQSDMSIAFYGCRQTDDPNFYLFGRVLYEVTHWMPLPDGPAAMAAAEGATKP